MNNDVIKLFYYPRINIEKKFSKNTYQEKVIESFEQNNIYVVNKRVNRLGILSILKHLFNAEVFYFNFIENLPSRKFGIIQTILFPLILIMLKVLNKKIIWVMHNKISHTSSFHKLKSWIFYLMLTNSNRIITHSKDGKDFAKTFLFKEINNIKFIHHPISNHNIKKMSNLKLYDILIWGSITDYKGVEKFLKEIYKSDQFSKLKILIAGKAQSADIKKKILKFQTQNIEFINEYISEENLVKFHQQSRNVLFTHQENSVLSSAALMKSISYGSHIIGPDVGAFKDLSNTSFVSTYKSFSSLEANINLYIENKIIKSELDKFISENSWDKFGASVHLDLSKI